MNFLQSRSTYSKVLVLIIFLLLVAGAVLVATAAAEQPLWQARVAEAGYLGVFAAGIVGGLNFVVPIPPATLSPLFIAAGLSVPLIIISLAIGTLVADFAGYFFGRVSKAAVEKKHPTIFATFTRLGNSYRWYLLPVVALYAAFVPFPNEAILIPLAMSGVRFTLLLPALIIGNIAHQATLVYSITNFTVG